MAVCTGCPLALWTAGENRGERLSPGQKDIAVAHSVPASRSAHWCGPGPPTHPWSPEGWSRRLPDRPRGLQASVLAQPIVPPVRSRASSALSLAGGAWPSRLLHVWSHRLRLGLPPSLANGRDLPTSAPETGKQASDTVPEPGAGLQAALAQVALSIVCRVRSLWAPHTNEGAAGEYADAGEAAVIAVPAAWDGGQRERSGRTGPALSHA